MREQHRSLMRWAKPASRSEGLLERAGRDRDPPSRGPARSSPDGRGRRRNRASPGAPRARRSRRRRRRMPSASSSPIHAIVGPSTSMAVANGSRRRIDAAASQQHSSAGLGSGGRGHRTIMAGASQSVPAGPARPVYCGCAFPLPCIDLTTLRSQDISGGARMTDDVFLYDAVRTPFGRYGGALGRRPPRRPRRPGGANPRRARA